MRLIKLEMHGFKSFAKKTEIFFDRGITAIVGPNGSGKSNIADAIRWVLGEQSARLLRGNRMEDVIFGGTATRKQLGFCEVTLTFDNSDGILPVDFTEVSVTRRVYRTGDSEYCINGAGCRLKDINELFRDTGLGKEGYSIVGQGKVEEILSNKSGERRKAFEEAAGIMKYRVRKEEAERNLDKTRKNLLRLSDILYEIEERLEPLSKQCHAAEEYLRLRDELRGLEINLFLYQYDKIKERLTGIDEAITQLDAEIEAADAVRSETVEKCATTEEAERRISDELSQLQTELVAMSTGLETHIGNIRVLDERIASAEREKERLRAEILTNNERRREVEQRLNSQDDESAKREDIINGLRTDVSEATEALVSLNIQISDMEFDLENKKNALIDALNKISDSMSQISRFDAIKTSLEERINEIDAEKAKADAEKAELLLEFEEVSVETKQLNDEAETARADLNAAMAHANETNYRISGIKDEIRSAEQSLEGKRSRLSVLTEMKKAHEGYYASVRKVLDDCERNSELARCVEGVVAEIIKVPKEYETAIEMALGNALQNIVSADEIGAKKVIEHLRRNNYGRATLLPVTVIKSRTLSVEERRMIRVDGCYGVASELISFDDRYRGIAENLLGRTIIVRDLDTGILINKSARQAFRIATVDGDIINPGGSMTGGSVAKKEYSLLGRERECAELLSGMDAQKKELNAKRQKLAKLTEELELANAEVKKYVDLCHDHDVKLAQHADKVSIVEQYIAKNADRIAQAEAELSRIADNIADIEKQYEEAKKQQSELTQDNSAAREEIKTLSAKLTALRDEQAKKNETYTDMKVRLTALEKESDALKDEQKRLADELSKLIASIEFAEKAIEKHDAEQSEMLSEKHELEAKLNDERGDTKEVTDKCKSLEDKRSELVKSLDSLRTLREDIDSKLTDLRERKHKQEMNKSKSESELTSMQDKIWSDYELTYENALPYRRPIAVTSSHQRADELRNAMRQLGDINMAAIEDYKNLSERYDSIKSQCDDLEIAEGDLVTLIEELTSTMEDSFKEKFTMIRENFMRVFTELFGGGSADLILGDDKDILNCDIDILAQIPGKKLQSLAPLSGGERALTAIALQFAILGLKPTAFCLLDEIDASLDEINVTRFSDYIHAYAEYTQFILITHRKGSMESCNALYGVAQEEKGVSKVVSARFSGMAVNE